MNFTKLLSNLTLREIFLRVQIFGILVIDEFVSQFCSTSEIIITTNLEFMCVSQLVSTAEMNCDVNYLVGFMKTTRHCSFLFFFFF